MRHAVPAGDSGIEHTWLIIGPEKTLDEPDDSADDTSEKQPLLFDDVEVDDFNFNVSVVVLKRLSGRDVFARAVCRLADGHIYPSIVAAHDALRLVADAPQLPDDERTNQPL